MVAVVAQQGLASSNAASSSAPPRGGVLILGDSISAAYGLDKAHGWVALLAQRLNTDRCGLPVVNASVSGETTHGGLVRLPALLAEQQPAIVVIELGGNDGLRGLSPVQMHNNLRAMIAMVRAARAQPVLLGILIPPNYGETYKRLFEQAIADAAALENVPFLDFFLYGVVENAGWMQDDGIHPAAVAQPTLLTNAWEVLLEPLRQWCPSVAHDVD